MYQSIDICQSITVFFSWSAEVRISFFTVYITKNFEKQSMSLYISSLIQRKRKLRSSVVFFPPQSTLCILPTLSRNTYICKCFSLYDINNEIDVQFCMNTFDHVISFFQCVWIQYPRFSISGSLYYFHIVYQRKQYRLYGRKTHKKELIFISTRYIVVAYIVIS